MSYTCHALDGLAAACGFTGQPFKWDAARRRALQAQLDALFFLAYGFDKASDEASVTHILSTFPILNQQDPGYAALLKGYLRAYRAGRFEAEIVES